MSGFLLLLDEDDGWLPPADGIWPTAFSPTARGGVGTTFGIWADAGLLRTNHDATLSWCGVRTMSGISSGQKISCTCLIEGSTAEQGMGIINSAGTLASWAGSDANGFVLFFHVDEVYHNGGSIASLTGVTIGDRVRMDIDFDAATMQFYKQSGGSGAFVSMGSAISISALGAGPWYPVSNLYNANGQQTWDFGQTAFAVESGFTRGPVGDWGWWNDSAIVSAMTETWLASDTTRMWELSTSVGTLSPDVVNNDPVGGWYGILYARLLDQATAGQRPTYTTGGMRFDATGGTKQMADALAATVAQTAPFTVLVHQTLTSGKSIRAGYGTSATAVVSGLTYFTPDNEYSIVRGSGYKLPAAAVRSDACIVVTYDGTKAYALDSDGNWVRVNVGSGTTAFSHIVARATVDVSTVADLFAFQVIAGAVDETQARNLQWSARNVL